MNRHQFQQLAKKFRAGKISLDDFTQEMFPVEPDRSSMQSASEPAAETKLGIRLPERPADGHKGSFGHVLIIGGAAGMSGAPALAGLAALRSGAGLVTVATPVACVPLIGSVSPCLMTFPLMSEHGVISAAGVVEIVAEMDRYDVIGIGPGLRQSPAITSLLSRLNTSYEKPVVIDADALNTLANLGDWQQQLCDAAGPRVLTPHPGEFARLANRKFDNRQEMCDAAHELAASTKAVVALKGAGTQVSDGNQRWICPTGNSGMATAGSGDVLTGVIAALLGQKLPHFQATVSACYLHGLSGDLGSQALGSHGLIASDLIQYLPVAFRTVPTHPSRFSKTALP